jgi:ubiquitin carboxyl-terminal hydrolase 1
MKSDDEGAASAHSPIRSPKVQLRSFKTSSTLCLLFAHFVRADNPHSHGRYVLSHDNFVILDAQDAQQYRVLGVLPVIQTAWLQVILATAAIGVASLAALVILKLRSDRTAGSKTHWLSHVPEPFDRLAFYLHYEASAYIAVLVETVMSVVNVPMGIGLSLASRLSSSDLNAGSPRQRSYSDSLRLGERGSRRGKSAGKVQAAMQEGTSKVASSSRLSLNELGDYPGIWNTGNSCFLNSTLQCLASVNRMRTLLEHIIVQAERWDVPTPVTDALYDVIVQLNTASKSRAAIVPQQLTDALSKLPQTKVGSFFYAHQQQDAHELLVLITSAIDDEVKAIEEERMCVEQAQSVGLRAIFAPTAANELAGPSKRKQRLENPCRALIAQRTACLDCGYVEAVRHYPADELSLTVPPRSGSATTIEACLVNWSRLEVVDWVCFRCSLLRTLERTKMDVSYLSALANAEPSGTSSNGKQINGAAAKKKSGAKRRKLREAREREEALLIMLKDGYGEDEQQTRETLARHEIQLVKAFSRAATKQVMLARTPKVLMIHLNRSSYSAGNFGASKNNAAILFDEELDLAEVVTAGDLSVRGDRPISRGVTPMDGQTDGDDDHSWSVQHNGRKQTTSAGKLSLDAISSSDLVTNNVARMKTRYRLCGIVVHYGGHSSGHYVAFRRRSTERQKSNGTHNANVEDIDEDDSDHDSSEEDSRARRVYAALSSAYDSDPSTTQTDHWYRISDDSVSRCGWHDVARQNPFLLFYERIGDADGDTLDGYASTQSEHANGTSANGQNEAMTNDVHVPQGFASFAGTTASRGVMAARTLQRWELLSLDRTATPVSGANGHANGRKADGCQGGEKAHVGEM